MANVLLGGPRTAPKGSVFWYHVLLFHVSMFQSRTPGASLTSRQVFAGAGSLPRRTGTQAGRQALSCNLRLDTCRTRDRVAPLLRVGLGLPPACRSEPKAPTLPRPTPWRFGFADWLGGEAEPQRSWPCPRGGSAPPEPNWRRFVMEDGSGPFRTRKMLPLGNLWRRVRSEMPVRASAYGSHLAPPRGRKMVKMGKMGAWGPHLDHPLGGREMVEMVEMEEVGAVCRESPTSWG